MNVFQSVYEDVMRQAASFQADGKTPIRIRIGECQWRHVINDRACLPLIDPGDPEARFCGLPVRIDRDWDAPVAVETASDQKPPL
jgi:hypothetical protein